MSSETLPKPGRFRLRRTVGRDPQIRRGSSPLELLFDLTFVVAFAQAGDQLAHSLAAGHLGTAVGGFAFIVIAVCWAWISYSWFASAYDPDDWLHRVLTMVQMVGVVVLALGIPDVFRSIDQGVALDYRTVAVGYVIMRISMIAMWARVARHDPASRRTAVWYIVFTAGAQLGWVALAVFGPQAPALLIALIVVLWIVELCGPVVSTWQPKDASMAWHGTPWNADHIVERYGLLAIITLGEVILGTVAAVAANVQNLGWTGEAVLIAIAGVGLAFGLWWTYFIFPAAAVLGRHRERKWAWSYGHVGIFGALAAVGAGLEVAASAAEGHTHIGTVAVVLTVAVPVFIYEVLYFVLWSVLFRAVDTFHLLLAVAMVALLILALAVAGWGAPLGWCLLVVMASPAVVAIGYETGGYRHVEADVRREG